MHPPDASDWGMRLQIAFLYPQKLKDDLLKQTRGLAVSETLQAETGTPS